MVGVLSELPLNCPYNVSAWRSLDFWDCESMLTSISDGVLGGFSFGRNLDLMSILNLLERLLVNGFSVKLNFGLGYVLSCTDLLPDESRVAILL